MARTVAIGVQDFEEIIKKDRFYIDKTAFIRQWWENGDSVTLITRPRRFGKTLNMSMLEVFFSNRYQGRGDLFEGLQIWQHEEYRKLQGTYPVISLSFAGVKDVTSVGSINSICDILKEQYCRYSDLLQSEKLLDEEKKHIKQMMAGVSAENAKRALYYLSSYLCKHYGKKTIILLDEYDTPMQEAYVYGYWKEFTAFIRSLFNSAFKTNPYMERAVMTGITRVSKESIFSDLNNLEVVTTTSDKYATAFGFTEEEVFAAMDEMGLTDKEGVKHWYDGFVFGEVTDIYNPWSIINYLDKRKYSTYWANTSSNSLVGKLIRESGSDIKQIFEKLLRGEDIEAPVDEQIVYQNLDTDEGAIWSLLLATGYLKVLHFQVDAESDFDEEYPIYTMTLTNEEVRRMFYRMVKEWFSGAKESYNEFIEAMLTGDLKMMNRHMTYMCETVFSYFDTGKGPMGAEPERFYHGFVLGMVVSMSKEYHVRSNRESGYGRYDIMIYPKKQGGLFEEKKFSVGMKPSVSRLKNAILMEFKVHDPEDEKDLSETVRAALAQIEERNYAAELIGLGFPEEYIKKYGFAFEGKKVLIGAGE